MNHGKRTGRSARSMTALASAVAVVLGTLSLAGCGNDEDELPPVNGESPVMEEQASPMEDAATAPGIDPMDTVSGAGAGDDAMPDQEPLPEAEQEPGGFGQDSEPGFGDGPQSLPGESASDPYAPGETSDPYAPDAESDAGTGTGTMQ